MTGLYSGTWTRSVGGVRGPGVSVFGSPLRQATSGEEFLEYSERQTKTRTGENPRDIRQIKPKMFAVPESERSGRCIQIIRREEEAIRNEPRQRAILPGSKHLQKSRFF